MERPSVIAIDGPAGAGKSTIARRLAEELGFVLLDTGALYRAVALAARDEGLGWEQREAIGAIAHAIAEDGALQLVPDPSAPKGNRVMLRGRDVSSAIRTPEISMGASLVSAIPAVREALLDLQRSVAAHPPGTVAEGRDMGSVVFPDATLKFFLTASLDVRAERRHAELEAAGAAPDLDSIRADVAQRDRQDSERAIAPLIQADDALLVDSSERGIDAILAEMLAVVRDALA